MEKLFHCQICERAIKANTGVIAHHGYQRPGQGWQTASCFGARYRPYEVACDAIPNEILNVSRYRDGRAAWQLKLETDPPRGFEKSRRTPGKAKHPTSDRGDRTARGATEKLEGAGVSLHPRDRGAHNPRLQCVCCGQWKRLHCEPYQSKGGYPADQTFFGGCPYTVTGTLGDHLAGKPGDNDVCDDCCHTHCAAVPGARRLT